MPDINDLKIVVYQLDEWRDIVDIRLERVGQIDGSELWVIREKGACLNKLGDWEYEPIPSSRTKAFFKRCRWKSADEAFGFWCRGEYKSRFEHIREQEFENA